MTTQTDNYNMNTAGLELDPIEGFKELSNTFYKQPIVICSFLERKSCGQFGLAISFKKKIIKKIKDVAFIILLYYAVCFLFFAIIYCNFTYNLLIICKILVNTI